MEWNPHMSNVHIRASDRQPSSLATIGVPCGSPSTSVAQQDLAGQTVDAMSRPVGYIQPGSAPPFTSACRKMLIRLQLLARPGDVAGCSWTHRSNVLLNHASCGAMTTAVAATSGSRGSVSMRPSGSVSFT
eukprot:scaffold263215_cov39-Prasinocladus_malaysianus.AAC.6